MITKLQNYTTTFALITITNFLFACSKTNAYQMPAQSIDTVATQNDTTKTYLALGDSYTIGQSVIEKDRYPVQTAGLLNNAGFKFKPPEIIATTGWTTVNLASGINSHHFADSVYDIVTLLIGVNDQYQGSTLSEYEQQFIKLVQQSIVLAGGKPTHVIILSIPDYSVTPFASSSNKTLIASEIDSFNVINKQISGSYHTNYINVTGESRKAANDPSLIASDGLHFSGKEYAIWAGMLTAQIENILK
jgi:lysophospholipase L1-like esterase